MVGRWLLRAAQWGLRRYFGGPGRSWLLGAAAMLGFRAVRSVVAKREVIEEIPLAKGDDYRVEHLKISHRRQLKAERKARRS